MLLAIGIIGNAQITARHWLDRDGTLSKEEAVAFVSNLIWRGISGFPRQS